MYGGITENIIADPEENMYIADVNNRTVDVKKPPTFLNHKMRVFGATSVWLIEDDTLLLIGGSTPPLGYGGRSIFMYSRRKNDIDFCDLGEQSCLVNEDHDGDNRLIVCDKCESDIHFYCDPKMRKKTRVPEQYICPRCTGKTTNKKRKFGGNK
jgi:hypothetical protein